MNTLNPNNNRTLIICYGYEGQESKNANAICVYNLLSEADCKENFTVITVDSSRSYKDMLDGVCVYNLTPKERINPFYKDHDIKATLRTFKDEAVALIRSIHEDKPFRNILSISFTFVNLEIGKILKNFYPEIKLLVYELDPYAYNNLLRLPNVLFLYRWFKEQSVFRAADKILLTNELYEVYRAGIFGVFRKKFVCLGIPMLKVQSDDMVIKQNAENKIVYTGSLSKKYRDPSYMLELFSIIIDRTDWTIHIYGASRESIDVSYIERLGDKLRIHDKVPREQIPEILREASLLINISNTTNVQLPSKILDYIGFRKPIINFYSTEDDICVAYLKDYPVSISIKENWVYKEQNAEELYSFIKSATGKVCDEDTVSKRYKLFQVSEIYKLLLAEL